MKLSRNTLIVKLSFWGVILGELIDLAHSWGMDKKTLFHGSAGKFGFNYILQLCGQIPEQLGYWISFIFCSILWMYMMEIMRRRKVFLFTSISLSIALDGLGYLLIMFFASEGVIGEVGMVFLLLILLADMVTMGYLAVVLIAKTDDMRVAGFLLGAQVLLMAVYVALVATDNENYGSWMFASINFIVNYLFYHCIKEECCEELEEETVEIVPLHYMQLGYIALIMLMLQFFVVL